MGQHHILLSSGGFSLIRLIANPVVAKWVVKNLRSDWIVSPKQLEPCVCFGVMDGERAIAGIVFNNFHRMPHGNDISITAVATSPRWATRHVLKELGRYVFDQNECVRLTAQTREGNEQAAGFLRRVGFRKEGVARRAYGGKSNAIIWSLLPHEFKYGDFDGR